MRKPRRIPSVPPPPIVHLHNTNLRDSTAEISINGQRYLYQFLTSAEIDTVKYLFTISGLKALNYAKRHSESSRRLDHANDPVERTAGAATPS